MVKRSHTRWLLLLIMVVLTAAGDMVGGQVYSEMVD